MKKYFKLLLMLIVAVTFMRASCEKNDEDDVCDKKEALINGTFILSTNVKYSDGTPYQGFMKFKIYKMYCGASTPNGVYQTEGNSNADGYYSTGMIYTYKFENLYDRVSFYFSIINEDTDEEKKVWREYTYSKIEAENAYTINETVQITLPWTKEE